jgi:hypothetical protein
MRLRSRAALLVACLLAGTWVGAGGYELTGSQWWFVAIPAAVAAAWWSVADPQRCAPVDAASFAPRRASAKVDADADIGPGPATGRHAPQEQGTPSGPGGLAR